jgi:hypothetical protein
VQTKNEKRKRKDQKKRRRKVQKNHRMETRNLLKINQNQRTMYQKKVIKKKAKNQDKETKRMNKQMKKKVKKRRVKKNLNQKKSKKVLSPISLGNLNQVLMLEVRSCLHQIRTKWTL